MNTRKSKKNIFSKAILVITKLSPVNYYREDRILTSHISDYLEDATIDEFITVYKNYQTNYFEKLGNKKVIFYTYGPQEWSCELYLNEMFFKTYKPNKYYCKKSSFSNIESMLVKEHYNNKKEYNEALKCLDARVNSYFNEGSYLLSFHFYEVKKEIRIAKRKTKEDYSECCALKINNWQ